MKRSLHSYHSVHDSRVSFWKIKSPVSPHVVDTYVATSPAPNCWDMTPSEITWLRRTGGQAGWGSCGGNLTIALSLYYYCTTAVLGSTPQASSQVVIRPLSSFAGRKEFVDGVHGGCSHSSRRRSSHVCTNKGRLSCTLPENDMKSSERSLCEIIHVWARSALWSRTRWAKRVYYWCRCGYLLSGRWLPWF